MPIDEARTITRESILHGIGGLPRDKYHCSVLAADALNKAIVHFEQFKKTS
jgi:nitrogen fixation NifU-like protein